MDQGTKIAAQGHFITLNLLVIKCVLAVQCALFGKPLSADDYARIELLITKLEELLPMEWYLQGKAPIPDIELLGFYQFCRDNSSPMDTRQFESAIKVCKLIIECNGSVGTRELDSAIKALNKVGDYFYRAVHGILNNISSSMLFTTV